MNTRSRVSAPAPRPASILHQLSHVDRRRRSTVGLASAALIVSVLSVVPVLGGSSPAVAAPSPKTHSRVTVKEAEARALGHVGRAFERAKSLHHAVEDPKLRKAYSRTWVRPDGQMHTEISQAPTNYRDGRAWRRIDTSLVPSANGQDAVENAANSFHLSIPSTPGARPVRLTDQDGGWLSYRLHGLQGPAVVDGSTAAVTEGPDGTKVTFTSTPSGVEDSLTLDRRPERAPVFSYDVRMLKGLTPQLSGNQISVSDSDGHARFTLPAPFMTDASESSHTGAVGYGLTKVGVQHWVMTVTPDAAWLADPSRVYPVVVDPVVTTMGDQASDLFMDESDPSANNSGGTWLWAGGASGNRHRSLMKFNMSAQGIPATATVTSATLKMFFVSMSGTGSVDVAVRAMNPSGSSGGTTWDSSAHWTGSGTGTSWTGGNTYYSGSMGDVNTLQPGEAGSNQSWNVTDILQDWISTPSHNNGLMIKPSGEPNTAMDHLDANEGGSPPVLTINWNSQAPTVGTATIQPNASTTDGLFARSLQPTFGGTTTDVDSTTLSSYYLVLDAANPSTVIAQSPTTPVASPVLGQASALTPWTVNPGVLQSNHDYILRTTVFDESPNTVTRDTPFTTDVAPAVPANPALSPVCAACTGTLTTPSLRPTLSATVSDPDSDALNVKFEVQTSPAGAPVVSTAFEAQSGDQVSYRIPDGKLANNATYQYRVGADDGVSTSYTSWQTFKVDTSTAAFSGVDFLREPTTIYGNGALLTWEAYDDPTSASSDDLLNYEVYRAPCTYDTTAKTCAGSAPAFSHSITGLKYLGSVPADTTSFTDQTATPSGATTSAYWYWVAPRRQGDTTGSEANGYAQVASNARPVVMPIGGRVLRVYTGDVPDATISSGTPTAPGPAVLQSGTAHGTSGKQHGLLSFDLSDIDPALMQNNGLVVTATSLTLTAQGGGNTGALVNQQYEIRPLNQNFDESSATWNSSASGTSWTTSGGDAGTALASASLTPPTGTSHTRVTFTSTALTNQVKTWASTAGSNHGLLLRATDESGTAPQQWVDWTPSETSTMDSSYVSYAPRLTVEYVATPSGQEIQAPQTPVRFLRNSSTTVPVTVTNTTGTTWQTGVGTGDIYVSYRWVDLSGATVGTGTPVKIGTLRGGESSAPVDLTISTPQTSNNNVGQDPDTFHLWYVLVDSNGNSYSPGTFPDTHVDMSDTVCGMEPGGLVCPQRVVEDPPSDELGLEQWATYAGEETGSGSQFTTNLHSGNLVWNYDAFSIPSIGPSMFARVTYNSQDTSSYPTTGFGISVQAGALTRLGSTLGVASSTANAPGRVSFTDGDGTTHTYILVNGNATVNGERAWTYRHPAGVDMTLTAFPDRADEDARWVFTRPDGTQFYYRQADDSDKSTSGRPSMVVDPSGNRMVFVYDSQTGNLTSVQDSTGDTVATLAYLHSAAGSNVAGKLAYITAAGGSGSQRVLSFGYSSSGILLTIKDGVQNPLPSLDSPGPSTCPASTSTLKCFALNYRPYNQTSGTDNVNTSQAQRLLSVTDPRGNATTLAFYNGGTYRDGTAVPTWANGWTSGYQDRGGQVTTYEYRAPSGEAKAQTVVADVYDARVGGVSLSSPGSFNADRTTYRIDGYGRAVAVRDANANAISPPSATDTLLNDPQTSHLVWNNDHQVVSMTDASGATTRTQYDAASGYPVKQWDAEAVAHGAPVSRATRMTLDSSASITRCLKFPDANANDSRCPANSHTLQVTIPITRISQVTDPNGAVTTFGYTGTNPSWLTSVTSPRKDANGQAITTQYSYNAGDGTLHSTTSPNGKVTTYDYSLGQSGQATHNPGYPTTVTPPCPSSTECLKPTTILYDNAGDVVQSQQAGSSQTLTTTASYDVFGRPLSVTTPGAQGGARTTTSTYDPNDNVKTTSSTDVSVTSPVATTTSTYLPDDSLQTQTLPDNTVSSRTVRYAYDITGQLEWSASPRGASNPATLNNRDSSVLTQFPATTFNNVTYYLHDHLGQVTDKATQMTNESGSTVLAKSSYQYDAVGNLTKTTDPLGNITRSSYDLDGRDVADIDALGFATRTTYDNAGQITQTTDQKGNPTTYAYYDDGLQKSVTTHHAANDDRTTSYAYDNDGNMVTTTRPDGVQSTQQYDALDHVTAQVSPGNGTDAHTYLYFGYDDLGRMVKQYEPSASAGGPTSTQDATSIDYFGSGDIKTSTDPWGISTAYEYDQYGDQTKRTMNGVGGGAARTQSWTYFADGSMKSRADVPEPTVALVDSEDDTDANRTDTADDTVTGSGNWTTVTAPATDNRVGKDYMTGSSGALLTWKLRPTESGTYTISASCPKPGTATATYSLMGSATSVSGSLSVDQTQCTTTGARWFTIATANLTADQSVTVKVTGPSGSTILADAVRAVKGATPANKGYTYSYDADGNQTKVVDTNTANDPSLDSQIKAFQTTYDQVGQPLRVDEYPNTTLTGSPSRFTTYTYDLDGNTRSVTASRAALGGTTPAAATGRSTTYTYDVRNLVTSLTATIAGDGTNASYKRMWSYAYDPRGLVTTWTKPGNTSTSTGNVTTYNYYADGMLRTSDERNTDGIGTVDSHVLTYTVNGDIQTDDSAVRRSNASTLIQQKSAYDYYPNEQLKSVDKSGAQAGRDEAYTYDTAGNVKQQTLGSDITTYKYDRERLLSSTQSGAVTQYHYDPYGRTSTVTSGPTQVRRYTYDGFDRIVSQTKNDGGPSVTQTTVFDPFDRPASRTTGTSKVTYRYLGLSKQVAAEQKANGSSGLATVKAYTYAPNGKPLSLVSNNPDGTGQKIRYYSLNPHGDTEALTDPSSGATDATYRYTAYGDQDTKDKNSSTGDDAMTNQTPPSDPLNPLQFQAQRINGAFGDYDTGFRTYDPGLNRFLSRDMYGGALSDFNLGTDPWSTNRYMFTGGNPISNVDLTGHMMSYKTPDSGGGCTTDSCVQSTDALYEQWDATHNDDGSPIATSSDDGGGWLSRAKSVAQGGLNVAQNFTPAGVVNMGFNNAKSVGAQMFNHTGGCADHDVSECGGLFVDLVSFGAVEATKHDAGGCASHDVGSCGMLWVDLVSIGFEGGGIARAGSRATAAAAEDVPLASGKLYVTGSKSANNLTPRLTDTDGLSSFDTLEAGVKPGGKGQCFDVACLAEGGLGAFKTGPPGHYSIRPLEPGGMDAWLASRAAGTEAESPFTQFLQSIAETVWNR